VWAINFNTPYGTSALFLEGKLHHFHHTSEYVYPDIMEADLAPDERQRVLKDACLLVETVGGASSRLREPYRTRLAVFIAELTARALKM